MGKAKELLELTQRLLDDRYEDLPDVVDKLGDDLDESKKLYALVKKYGKSVAQKVMKLKKRAKPRQKVVVKDGKPKLVTKSTKEIQAGIKAKSRLKAAKKRPRKALSKRQSDIAARKLKAMGL